MGVRYGWARALTVVVAGLVFAAGCTGDDTALDDTASGDTTVDDTAVDAPESVAAPDCDGSVESPSVKFIVDECGRVLILRGVNVESSSKGGAQSDNHLPASGLAAHDEILDWGWNNVRFLVFWGAIEPEKGKYDEDYLDQVETWLDWYAEHDIEVVLDMHQDLYGWEVGGNGAPDWAVETDGLEFAGIESGLPWYLAATDEATQTAYQNFWNKERGHAELQEHYLASLQHLAERFADHPAVIGFDVMNEPVFANGDLNETLAIVAEAEAGTFKNPNLNEFMQGAIEAVRSADEDAWVFVEPTSLLNAFPFPSDLDPALLNDPREGPARLVFASHFYEPIVHDSGGYGTDSTYVADWEAMRFPEATELDAAMWIGEWGGSADQDRFGEYVNDVTQMLDRNLAGGTWWSWDPGGWGPLDSDHKMAANGRSLLRVQPRAIAGTPEEFSWDAETSSFEMTWSERSDAKGLTEIAVPSELFPDGPAVELSDADGDWSFEWDRESNVLTIDADRTLKTHSVRISSK